MGWIQIVGLVITYGPKLVKLAFEIYRQIEEFSDRRKNDPSFDAFDGEKTDSKDKQMRFDLLMKLKAREERNKKLSPDEIEELREGVVKYKNRKRGKTRWAR